jgi:hypothetical protein
MPGRLKRTIFGQYDPLVKAARLRAVTGGGGGPVVAVTATAPLASSGGIAPNITIAPATDIAAGSMSAADKAKLDALAPGDVTSVTASFPLTSSGGATPNLAPANNQSLVGTFATGALLTASPIPSTGAGKALVATYGAEFTLQPAASNPLAPDVVLASSNVAFVWVRSQTVMAAQAAAQLTWFVDRVGGSNEATGLTGGTALKTKSEIVRRWGTRAPLINGIAVTITYLSPDVDGMDTGNFQPIFQNGGSLNHFAAFGAAAFTGTLLAVTPKSVAGNTALESTFTTTTGAMAANLILVNATRGNSRAIAVRNIAGGNWLLTQPLAPYVVNTNPVPTEVDTWANGDAISGFVPLAVDLAFIGGVCEELNQTTFQPAHVVQQITIFDPSTLLPSGSTLQVDTGAAPSFIDCVVQRNASLGGRGVAPVAPIEFQGVAWTAGVDGTSGCNNVRFSGGYFGTGGSTVTQIRGAQFAFDVILRTANALGFFLDVQLTGSVFLDTGAIFNGRTVTQLQVSGKFYGSGTLNQQQGTCTYTGTAVAAFNGVTLKLNGNTVGYSNLTTAGLVAVHGGIALTAAALDAAAGAAGFGGYAYGGGATFSGNGAQP